MIQKTIDELVAYRKELFGKNEVAYKHVGVAISRLIDAQKELNLVSK